MNIRNFLLPLLCAGAISASAVPARQGVVHTKQQPDGTSVSLYLVGDETCHYFMTMDNKIVVDNNGRYCYATVDADGLASVSDVLAHDVDMRSADETMFAAAISTESVRTALHRSTHGMSRSNSHDGQGLYTNTFPTKGDVKALVFLVQYQDVQFQTPDASDYFHNMINQEGFSEYNAVGSVKDYFNEVSLGQFNPQFDVYGPVTLPNNRAYYGGNNTSGNDQRPQYMMLHAAQLLDDQVDFSQYDTDNDGYVDNVFIFYAGESEAQCGIAECVWPHAWTYTFAQRFDNVRFKRYACASELVTATPLKPDGIGTFIHEFSHVMGLPDLYNTNDAFVSYTPCSWDIMDQGCYNNDSRTPPSYSAFERNALGWMGDNLVEITGPASCTLTNLFDSNQAYVISTERSNEFFIFENRQKTRWDEYLPYHGMLVWHIDYEAAAWTQGVVNNYESHQRVDLVEATGRVYSSTSSQRRYPFPGLGAVRKFVFGGSPSFQSWSGANLGLDITDIAESNGIIKFNVAGGGDDPASITDVTFGKADCRVVGRAIDVTATGAITIADVYGRVVATGDNTLHINVSTPGMYIVSTPDGTSKLIIR